MEEPLEGISFNFAVIFCLFAAAFSGWCNTRSILNKMPAPDVVFVFIKISYKICYNRFSGEIRA